MAENWKFDLKLILSVLPYLIAGFLKKWTTCLSRASKKWGYWKVLLLVEPRRCFWLMGSRFGGNVWAYCWTGKGLVRCLCSTLLLQILLLLFYLFKLLSFHKNDFHVLLLRANWFKCFVRKNKLLNDLFHLRRLPEFDGLNEGFVELVAKDECRLHLEDAIANYYEVRYTDVTHISPSQQKSFYFPL